MEIIKIPHPEALEVKIKGRLDSSWSDYLSEAVTEIIHDGADVIHLNMAEINYISSAGIRFLVKHYKQLSKINGSFLVIHPSESVRQVLEISGLSELLTTPRKKTEELAKKNIHISSTIQIHDCVAEVYELDPSARLNLKLIGDPEKFEHAQFSESDETHVVCSESMIGIGLGALGADAQDRRSRYGEFLIVPGAAIHQKTDWTLVPDYEFARGSFKPNLFALYSILCTGAFSHHIRFSATQKNSPTSLSDLIQIGFDVSKKSTISFVSVAESAGIIGTAVRRSPAMQETASRFTHPSVKDWFSFTPDRIHSGSTAVTVGFASKERDGLLLRFLRPMLLDQNILGHFHSAIFPQRSFGKGFLELSETIDGIFENGDLRPRYLEGMYHLLTLDHQDGSEREESAFMQGACWIGSFADNDVPLE